MSGIYHRVRVVMEYASLQGDLKGLFYVWYQTRERVWAQVQNRVFVRVQIQAWNRVFEEINQ
jgi:hypothetical protein